MGQSVNTKESARVFATEERETERSLHAAGFLSEVRANGSKFLAVALQLGLLLLVMHAYQVEQSFGLLYLTPLIFAGFIINALLPLRYRLPFFLLLSLAAIGVVLGLKQGLGLIAVGLGLIGLCHLPVSFKVRVVLLLSAGAFLAGLRGGWIETSWASLPTLVLPVLGAMFMFRLAIYLYDLRHEKRPASLWERLSYFFMLPNICFLLFPVVDYQTFRRTYYDSEAAPIYQKGVLWMFRGVVHLLLYRLIYYHLIPNPLEVASLGGVVQSMLTTYLLYLRISGQFHMIIGIMCLFGFNLPETHHLYFLASSFNDYWRRINIYWKDFMMKLFYYPSLMQLRRWGMTAALVGATLVVFFGTWILHSYQWFWLRGTFPLTAPDALFWGILGGFVVVNSLYEARRTRKRVVKKKAWSVREAAILSLKTVGMFSFICVLWSLWSSPSVAEWVALVSKAGNSGASAFGLLLLALAALVGVGVLIQYATSRGWSFTATGSNPSFRRSALVTSVGTLVLLVGGLPQVHEQVGGPAQALVTSLQQEQLNRQDELQAEQGYYEGLLNVENYTLALMRTRVGGTMPAPADWLGLGEIGATRKTGDLQGYDLRPMLDVEFKRARFRTNRWGMRDQDYEKGKPENTYRIALLGSSHVMGSGVADEETFQWILEDRLNHESQRSRFDAYEVLNFAVGGHGLHQQVTLSEKRVFQFGPDAVVYVLHPGDLDRIVSRLAATLTENPALEDPSLLALLQQAEVFPGMKASQTKQRLHPFRQDLIKWGFGKIAALCKEHNVIPALAFMPLVGWEFEEQEIAQLRELARTERFVLLDLREVYQSHDYQALRVAAWDGHPNPLGHRLVADRLYQELLRNEALLGLGLSAEQDSMLTSP